MSERGSTTTHVLIITAGRPYDVGQLLARLRRQTTPPDRIWVVCTKASDVDDPVVAEAARRGDARLFVAGFMSMTAKRNLALDAILSEQVDDDFVVIYFDDDYVPADDWIEKAVAEFRKDPGLAGLTGQVLADGCHSQGVPRADALRYLSGDLAPLPHWTGAALRRELRNVNGSNMAFSGKASRACRFDDSFGDALGGYVWLEDSDYSAKARRFGRLILVPECKGVHLSCKSGRDNGFSIGYKQVRHALHFMRLGTVDRGLGAKLIMQNVVANTARSFRPEPWVDRRGRLRGNLSGLLDAALGRSFRTRA